MLVYNIAPPAAVNTSASANTDVDHLRLLTVAARIALITGLLLRGKSAAQTTITGIETMLKRFATASTVGSAITPVPKGSTTSSPAARLTAFTGPTIGTTPTIALALGCTITGPGAWQAATADHNIDLDAGGGAGGNLDLISQTAGTVALPFGYNLEFAE
jgi:hypothetical protein